MLHLETECMWNLLIADLISNGKSEKQETTKIKHSSFMIFFFFFLWENISKSARKCLEKLK